MTDLRETIAKAMWDAQRANDQPGHKDGPWPPPFKSTAAYFRELADAVVPLLLSVKEEMRERAAKVVERDLGIKATAIRALPLEGVSADADRAGSPPDRSPEGSPRSACSSLTHTPGPWRVVTEDHWNGVLTQVVDANDDVVCCNEPYYPTALNPKNAHLIAAAPEMLEALKWANEFACESEAGRDPAWYAAFDRLELILAKAEPRISDGSPEGEDPKGLNRAAATARPDAVGGCPSSLPLEQKP